MYIICLQVKKVYKKEGWLLFFDQTYELAFLFIKNLKNSMQKFTQVKLSDQYVVNMRQVLGKGSTGCVYQGRDLRTHEKVAVKVIELCTIDNEVTEYLLKMQKNAIMILSSPYVLKGLRILQDQRYCFMVTQYCNGGTLKNYIKNNICLPEKKSFQIIKELLEGYQNLVEKKVVHRDLKPANVMMHNESPKIIDFGYCEIEGYKKPTLQYNVGSPSYMAPQSYELNVYNQKTQIWSIGVILYECLTGKTLDQGQKMDDVYRMLCRNGVKYPDNVSQLARNIIDWCLRINPKSRPTCSELLSKYFSGSQKAISLNNNFTQQQNYKTQRSISTLTSNPSKVFDSLNNLDKVNVLEQNVVREQTKTRLPRTTVFGPLTNTHQQSINKYVQNRLRPTFSSYQHMKMSQYIQQPPYMYKEGEQNSNNRILGQNKGHQLNINEQNKNNMKRSQMPLHNPSYRMGYNPHMSQQWQRNIKIIRKQYNNPQPLVGNPISSSIHHPVEPSFVNMTQNPPLIPRLSIKQQESLRLTINTERPRIASYRI